LLEGIPHAMGRLDAARLLRRPAGFVVSLFPAAL
jgi:hypothetical protein